MGFLKNDKGLSSTWPVMLAICFLADQSMAEDFQTKTATISAPQEVTTSMSTRAMVPPNADRLFNDRQSKIGGHHRPIPIGELTQAMRNAMHPPSNMASTVLAATNVASSSITLETNRALSDQETNDSTSTVHEPSVSVRGPEILYTGNWYAAFSTDNGATFSYMNPDTTFPNIPNQPWCCDSYTRYDKNTDTMFWFLQYVHDGNGNTIRLALAQGDDISNQNWRFYDFTPKAVGNWDNAWFDYPAMAISENNLYITINKFSANPCTPTNCPFKGAVIFRLPLEKLAAYEGFTYNYFETIENGALRPTQGATDTMYFGDHVNPQTLRVFSWPENSSIISSTDVSVDVWTRPFGTAVAPGPDGNDWVGRVDSRVTAAWKSGDTLGFAWTAAQDSNFAFPHVRVALLNKDTKAVIGQPHLWNSNFAFAYPAAAPNSNGVVGISVLYGGGSQFHPSHAVGFLKDSNTDWELVTTINGTHGPNDRKSGDYVTIEKGPNSTSWVTTGFSLQEGSTRTDIQPRYVRFSKKNDEGNQLSITKTDQADPVQLGDPVTYTLTITNQGPNSATGVVLTDPLPNNVSFISATPNTCSENEGTVTCSLEDLAKDASTTASITVGTLSAGTISNTASVTADQFTSVSVTETTGVGGEPPPSMCSAPEADISQERNVQVTDTLNISEGGTLTDLNVSLDVSHTYVGDLVVTLEHEAVGSSTILVNRPIFTQGNCKFDDIQVTFDDSATKSVQDTCMPDAPTINGTLKSQDPLSSFHGKELSGSWKLTVQDKAFFDGGKLNQWCLIPTVGN